MKSKKSSFYPISDLKDKANYKLYSIIQRDGSIIDRVFLDIPIPKIREKIICFHYLSRRIKYFYQENVGLNILNRDNPWDFKIELSTDEIFNIEITSIADDSSVFEKLTREERLKKYIFEDRIPLYELIKLNYFFPNVNISEQIDRYIKSNAPKDLIIKNPFKDLQYLLVSGINPKTIPLDQILKEAINKKELKPHSEKEKTILLVDNRTMMYELDDFQKAREKLSEYFKQCSFREIWLYTGYYSSLDGNDAEYSLAPLKITKYQADRLKNLMKKNPPDENNIMYD